MPGKRSDYLWRKVRLIVLRASTVCALCGHEGATDADHIVPPDKGGGRYDVGNLQPAHGVLGCPVCGRKCNQSKGDSTEQGAGVPLRTSRDWYRYGQED